MCLGKIHQHPESNEAWKKRIEGITTDTSYRDYDGINGESTEFEWNIFPGFTTLQLYGEVNDLLSDLGQTPEIFTGIILFMSMFNDISCDKKDNQEECLANAEVVSILAKKFGIGQWSFIGPGSEKKWYSMEENSPQGRNAVVPGYVQKQRTWKTVNTFHCRLSNSQSAQSSRSSCKHV